MNELLYIVFNDLGYYLSEKLKKHNNNIKIIHFCNKNMYEDTKADLRVELNIEDNVMICDEYLYNKYIADDEKFNIKFEDYLYNFRHAIVITDILSDTYPIDLSITKQLVYANIDCHNVNFKPFSFMGRRKLNHYKEFYNELNGIKSNNYNFNSDVFLNDLGYDNTLSDKFKKFYKNIYDIVIDIEDDLIPYDYINFSKYTYASVIYDDDIVAKTINEPSFYYKTNLPISIGDKVLVDREGKEVEGTIIDVESFFANEVPFPINKTKDIIKIIKKKPSFLNIIDPCYHILVIHDLDKDFENNLILSRAFVVNKEFSDVDKLIPKSDIIITVGDINISKYDISDKTIININNEYNVGKYTSSVNLTDEREYINLINAIYYALFYNGFIRFDLFDIQYGLGKKIMYKNYSIEEIEQVYKDFDNNNIKKMFLIFEGTPNTSLYDINEFVDKLRDKFGNFDITFGVPLVNIQKETRVNIFCEI